MPDDSPLVRQWILLRLLSRRYGVTVREMAEEVGVTEKTVRNMLQVLQAAGFPLEETAGQYGRKNWRMDPARMKTPPAFTFDEAITLYLSRRLLEPLAGTVFGDAAQRAFGKIRTMLSRPALDYAERLAGLFQPTTTGVRDYSARAESLDVLLQAIEDHHVVSLIYRSLRSAQAKTYEVHPYGLAYHRGSLYLVGLSVQRGAIRHWKVDRMVCVQRMEERFSEDFDLEGHLQECFGVYHGEMAIDVQVRFAPEVARYVQEAIWHPSQRLTATDDGGVVAEFRLSATEEVKHWVLSFGRHAEVLRPASLREEIMEELTGLLEQYQENSAEAAIPS